MKAKFKDLVKKYYQERALSESQLNKLEDLQSKTAVRPFYYLLPALGGP